MSPEKRPQPQPSRNSASRSRPANRGPKHRLGRNLMALALLLGLLGIGWKALAYFGFVPEGGDGGRIIALHPEVRQKSDQLVAQAAKKGIEVVITSDFRGVEEQDELYRQGREKPGNIVTNARGGQSYHNFGLAIDFALRDESDRIVWDMELDRSGNGRSDWREVVELAKDLGFEWGGDWSNFPDYPHLQITFGYTLRQLQNGKYPAGSAVERKQPEPNSSD
ncbi:M15 family metallopeptidase [Saccharibacillus qingshengii]|uniref:M15 family metallopeptidase n=1 Tax=Saccharibacillus qingshengii TaxID=1763540 RepID=UPI0024843435|nr:M15 family metallopeptidase [Saccharibacillus qingshengii]